MKQLLQEPISDSSIFSVQKYDVEGSERVSFAIQYNEGNKITFRVPKMREDSWEYKLLNIGNLSLYFSQVFSTSEVEGSLSVEEVMKDAVPVRESLESFFQPNPNSKYYNKITGLHGGVLSYYRLEPSLIKMRLTDVREDKNISGLYNLIKVKDEEIDYWGRRRSKWKLVQK